MRKSKNWEIGILLSSSGFEGVQFFDVTPKSQERVLTVLPKLHHIFNLLHKTIKTIEKGEFGNESENRNYS